ncbi:hypothetical protein Taro_001022 [Colocasia esculenta]|uniref:Aminotransferase-like plant mobile domain-containing protein n=1 Tax=Colocasia esculenta TaxID=4460 RepID=A0A843T8S8_COLES|nr:hypothetical protein [Colocasia esculenta]
MGFGPFLRLDELTSDVALIQALKEWWDPKCHAFLLPAGEALLDPWEEVLRLCWAIWRFSGVLVALSTRGCCMERGRRRAIASLGVLREGRGRPLGRDSVSCRAISWCRDQKAVLASVATATEGFVLYALGALVIVVYSNASSVGYPRFCVSQARECARALSRCSGTVEVLSSSWTPSLSGRVVVRLRERRQWDSDLLWWFGWSPQFFGFTYVVELQLDLSSVTLLLRLVSGDSLVVVCPSGGTIVFVFHWWYLVVVGTCTLCGYWFVVVPCVPVCLGGEVEVVRAGEALLDPGEEVLWLCWAIWRFSGVLIALSTRGRCMERGRRRAIASLGVLREGDGLGCRDMFATARSVALEFLSRCICGSRSDDGPGSYRGSLGCRDQVASMTKRRGVLTLVKLCEQVTYMEAELRDALAWTTALEAEMAELQLRPQADEVTGLRREVEELRSQLGTERHRHELLRSEMRGLESALALVEHSRSSASRSGIPSGLAGHYLMGSSGRQRNEEEGRRCEGAAEGSTTGPREMAPSPSPPPEGTWESG